MAIRVKHDVGGGDISALVRLAALAGQAGAQAPQAPRVTPMGAPGAGGGRGGIRSGGTSVERAAALNASRNKQMRAIEAQADRDKQSADQAMMRVALKAGLGEEMKEREYDMEIEKMQEQAKVKAKQFKWELSAKDQHEQAKINNALSELEKGRASGDWNPEEYGRMKQELMAKMSGIEPSRRSAMGDPPPLAEQVVTLPNGAVVLPARAGTVVTPADKSPEAIKAKFDQEFRMKELEIQSKREDAKEKAKEDFFSKLDLMTTKDPRTGNEVPLSIEKKSAFIRSSRYAEEFVPTGEQERALVQEALEQQYPEAGYENRQLPALPQPGQPPPSGQPHPAPQRPPAQQISEEQAAAAAAGSGEWWNAVQKEGVPVPEEFRQLSPRLGTAKSIYAAYIDKFGSFENIPKKYQAAVAEQILIIEKEGRE